MPCSGIVAEAEDERAPAEGTKLLQGREGIRHVVEDARAEDDVEPSQPLIFDRGRRMTEQARHRPNIGDNFALGNADLLCRHEVMRSNTHVENSPFSYLATRHL